MNARCRDFILTKEGLVFAVTEYLHPKDRFFAFLRFYPSADGFRKVGSTLDSYAYLRKHHREYLLDSHAFGGVVQSVALSNVLKVIKPDVFLRKLKPDDDFKKTVIKLSKVLSKASKVPIKKFGVTGSVLINAHNRDSDIDLVVYGLKNFNKVRSCMPLLKEKNIVKELSAANWVKWHKKRLPGKELTLDEFIFHEKRKNNSGVFNARKFDLLYSRSASEIKGVYGDERHENLGVAKLKAAVLEDSLAFNYPAIYKVEALKGAKVGEIASYTHTYTGQTCRGETVEARGVLQKVISRGKSWRRLLLGTTREAKGEYLKTVVNS